METNRLCFKSLLDAERNYAIYDKELLSIICGLEEWCHILEGTKHKIEISMTTKPSPTFALHRTLIAIKHAGHSTFPVSTLH